MKLPSEFTINGQVVKVQQVYKLPDPDFGQYSCITDTIKVAMNIEDDDKNIVKLTDEQILNSFYHELIHAFQWHSTGEYDEIQANTIAGYITEFLKTRKFNEEPNN